MVQAAEVYTQHIEVDEVGMFRETGVTAAEGGCGSDWEYWRKLERWG